MRLLLAALLAASLSAADLAGTWKGAMETQMGATDVTITIAPGAALAGKVAAGPYEGAIENGKLDGEKISFETTIEHGKVAYHGTVSGDEMKLDVTGTQGNKYKLVCRRQALAAAAGALSLEGAWEVQSNIGGTDYKSVCTFAQAEGQLSGTCKGDDSVANKLTGKVEGRKVSWSYKTEYNGSPLTVQFAGTLDDTKMSGAVTVPEFSVDGDFTAVRSK